MFEATDVATLAHERSETPPLLRAEWKPLRAESEPLRAESEPLRAELGRRGEGAPRAEPDTGLERPEPLGGDLEGADTGRDGTAGASVLPVGEAVS